MSSIVVIALELLERKDLGTALSLFNIGSTGQFASSLDLVEKEAHNLGLVDMTVIWVHLNQWLDELESYVWDAFTIDAFEHFNEVVLVDHTLIDLLIIFLQFGKHFVDFHAKQLLQIVDCNLFYKVTDLFWNTWLTLN